MKHEASQVWNEMWESMGEPGRDPDDLLKAQVEGLTPGRALEIGCGTGGNAVWLAEQGWNVTAIDFSEVAIDKGRKLAKERGVNVDFVAADATTYQPKGEFDLVTSFYIQLQPEQRVKMLAMASDALAPGGTLLFVSHDITSPPSGWDDEDLPTLTTPDEIVSELPGLKIEEATILKDTEGAHAHGSEDDHGSHEHEAHSDHHSMSDHKEPYHAISTVVRAVRPV